MQTLVLAGKQQDTEKAPLLIFCDTTNTISSIYHNPPPKKKVGKETKSKHDSRVQAATVCHKGR